MTFAPPDLPDKLYFKIGEVSSIAGVPSYVLRFWETEFKQINPQRTASGQRLYRKQDVERVLLIKHLLHEKKFTIKGAKKHLHTKSGHAVPDPTPALLEDIRSELRSIRDLLT
jgi:DNA-binding transcriptional MerR regulator